MITISVHTFLIDVTAEQLQAFIPSLFSRVYIEALLHGNISKKVMEATSNTKILGIYRLLHVVPSSMQFPMY